MTEKMPEQIRKMTEGLPYTKDTIGMSDSRVLLFDDMVLKIENQNKMTEQQNAMLRWLQGKLPVPQILWSENAEGRSWLLMTRIRGEMSCAESCMKKPAETVAAIAEGIHRFWSVDLMDCPAENSVDRMLREAGEHLAVRKTCEWNGTHGFTSPEKQLIWLEQNKPGEDTVFSHGDYCMPNVLLDNGTISGLNDLAQSGAADRWYDITLMLQSLERNFTGFFGGRSYPGFEHGMFFSALGLKEDKEKTEYFLMLDELFSV